MDVEYFQLRRKNLNNFVLSLKRTKADENVYCGISHLIFFGRRTVFRKLSDLSTQPQVFRVFFGCAITFSSKAEIEENNTLVI